MKYTEPVITDLDEIQFAEGACTSGAAVGLCSPNGLTAGSCSTPGYTAGGCTTGQSVANSDCATGGVAYQCTPHGYGAVP